MDEMTLAVLERDGTGSSGAKKTRSEGFVPGVLYGKDNTGQPVKMEMSSLRKVISRMGSSAIFNADYNGKTRLLMLKEVQTEPVGSKLLHVDLMEIDADQSITTTVPLIALGMEALPGGVILQQILHEIEVSCLPRFVPKIIEFDVAGMQPGQSVYVSELKVDDDVQVLTAQDELVATITEARAVVEEGEEEEAGVEAEAQETVTEE